MIVVDTNVVSYLLIEGPHTAVADRVYTRDADWRAPPLWRSEFLNVLATSVRAGVLDDDEARTAWRAACRLMRGREWHPAGEAVLQCAGDHGLSAYDAQFVVVARSLGAPLVTADKRILAAVEDISVSPTDFADEGA